MRKFDGRSRTSGCGRILPLLLLRRLKPQAASSSNVGGSLPAYLAFLLRGLRSVFWRQSFAHGFDCHVTSALNIGAGQNERLRPRHSNGTRHTAGGAQTQDLKGWRRRRSESREHNRSKAVEQRWAHLHAVVEAQQPVQGRHGLPTGMLGIGRRPAHSLAIVHQ